MAMTMAQKSAVSRALETLGEHSRMCGMSRIGIRKEEIENRLTELLTDLRQAAEVMEIGFESCVANSRRHFLDQQASAQATPEREEEPVCNYDEAFEGFRH